ncbi:MAG: hypothetical protein IJY73_04910 [Oscillospiraceae bacterium]|nr:hypothetical protein [Oscillospiraceae bacterium]
MIREATGMDIGRMAEIYEEYHLLNCRTRPDFYIPPSEDSFYFNDLSDRLLYGDDEIIISEDEESGIINGFCVFEAFIPDVSLRRKNGLCKIKLLIIRRGYDDKGIDGEMIEYVRNYAVENNCGSVEFSVWAESEASRICDNNGFEPKRIKMELKLK